MSVVASNYQALTPEIQNAPPNYFWRYDQLIINFGNPYNGVQLEVRVIGKHIYQRCNSTNWSSILQYYVYRNATLEDNSFSFWYSSESAAGDVNAGGTNLASKAPNGFVLKSLEVNEPLSMIETDTSITLNSTGNVNSGISNLVDSSDNLKQLIAGNGIVFDNVTNSEGIIISSDGSTGGIFGNFYNSNLIDLTNNFRILQSSNLAITSAPAGSVWLDISDNRPTVLNGNSSNLTDNNNNNLVNITAGTNINISGTNPLTISNTQIVPTLTAGTGINISGTNPITISNTQTIPDNIVTNTNSSNLAISNNLVNLAAGNDITLTTSGNTLTIGRNETTTFSFALSDAYSSSYVNPIALTGNFDYSLNLDYPTSGQVSIYFMDIPLQITREASLTFQSINTTKYAMTYNFTSQYNPCFVKSFRVFGEVNGRDYIDMSTNINQTNNDAYNGISLKRDSNGFCSLVLLGQNSVTQWTQSNAGFMHYFIDNNFVLTVYIEYYNV